MTSKWEMFYDKLACTAGITPDMCRCNSCVEAGLTDEIVEQALLAEFPGMTRIPFTIDPRTKFTGRAGTTALTGLRMIVYLFDDLNHNHKTYNDSKGPGASEGMFMCECCGNARSNPLTRVVERKDLYPNSETGGPMDIQVCSACAQRIHTCSDCGQMKYGTGIIAMHKTKEAYNYFRSDRRSKETGLVALHKDSRWVCYSCAFEKNKGMYEKCQHCGNVVEKDSIVTYPRGRDYHDKVIHGTLCNLCEEQASFTCLICGDKGYGRANWVDLRESNYYLKGVEVKEYEIACLKCYSDSQIIQGHQYKPLAYSFHWGKKETDHTDKTLTFGFELEVEMGTDSIPPRKMAKKVAIQYAKTDYYVVHDGSINNGIEIVGHPFSWAYFQENQNKIVDLLAFCARYGYNTNGPKVGFHVHTNKDSWESPHVYRLMKFMYDNNNRMFLDWMAGRKPTEHCMYSRIERDNLHHVAEMKKNYTSEHYNAVNLNGEHTIEFRIFRGSMIAKELFKYIEFTAAIHAFTLTAEPRNLKALQFRNFVRKTAKTYPHLAKAINEQYKK